MDSQFWIMMFKIIVLLPFILLIIYASLKFGGTKLQNVQKGKYIKILERVHLSKESSLLVVKIGSKTYAMSCNSHSTEILQELSDEELLILEKDMEVPSYKTFKEFLMVMQKKLKEKKEGNHEKNIR